MEACGSSQHWARRLPELGHEVSFGYQRRRGSGKWRGGTDRRGQDLRHQEPADPYRAHPRTGEAVSTSAPVSPSLKAEKAFRDAVNAGWRSWPWAGRRFRPGTPRIHPMWKSADYDTMTDLPGFTALLPGNPNVTDGLRAWLLPSWIRDCISGKEVMEALRIDAGQTRSPRSGVLKSRGCDTMTGASESISRWGSELRERNGLGRPDAGWCTPLGKSGRNRSYPVLVRGAFVDQYLPPLLSSYRMLVAMALGE